MDGFVNQATSLVVAIVAMWVVVVGIAVMVRGPRAGAAVLTWPIRVGFRLLRRAAGGLLIALGRAIRG